MCTVDYHCMVSFIKNADPLKKKFNTQRWFQRGDRRRGGGGRQTPFNYNVEGLKRHNLYVSH